MQLVTVNPGKYAPIGKSIAPKTSPMPATAAAYGVPKNAAAKATVIKLRLTSNILVLYIGNQRSKTMFIAINNDVKMILKSCCCFLLFVINKKPPIIRN